MPDDAPIPLGLARMGSTDGVEKNKRAFSLSRIHSVSMKYYGRVDSAAGYWLGILLGVVIGLIDVFFPGTYHNLAYYFVIYGSLGVLSGYFAAITAYRLFLVRTLGIASISMGFWAIAWSIYYFAFNYPEWHKVFVSDQLIGIGLGINVPTGTYIFSTIVQSLGGAILIFLTTPDIFDRLLGWAKKRFSRRA